MGWTVQIIFLVVEAWQWQAKGSDEKRVMLEAFTNLPFAGPYGRQQTLNQGKLVHSAPQPWRGGQPQPPALPREATAETWAEVPRKKWPGFGLSHELAERDKGDQSDQGGQGERN